MRKSRRRDAPNSDPFHAAWRTSWPGLSVVLVFSVLINVLKFAAPLYLIQVLDRIPASRSVETLVMLTAAALVAVLTGIALYFVRRRMLARWGTWIERFFGPCLLDRSLNQAASGDSTPARQALGDLSTLRSFVTRAAASWIDVIWAPVFFLGVYLMHPVLSLIVLGAVSILVISAIILNYMSREPRRTARAASSEAGQIVLGAERNIETVSALSMSRNVIERWDRSVVTQLDARDRSETRAALDASIRRGIGRCLWIGIIAVGIWLYLQNSLTLGGLFAARIMASFGYRLVERAVRNWASLQEALTAYKAVRERLSGDARGPVSFDESTYSSKVQIDDVSFRYQGSRDFVFRGLKLEILPGEVVLVIGDAATGKTTLSRLLVGRILPSRGRINIGDIELTRLPGEVRSELIGYLPQNPEFFTGTVRQNIARMDEGSFEDVVVAAKRAGMHDTILQLPQGYDTEISDNPVGLSGSERKRIALARAFYRSPRLIVLDEPLANLDWSSRRVLRTALQQLKQEGASIVVTQAIGSSNLQKIANQVVTFGGRYPAVARFRPVATMSPGERPLIATRSAG
jgi:ATP-binding cassette, subfamily C, bacterial exporter for protease/lipase